MSMLKSTVTVAGMTGASRLLGFARDMAIAAFLGAGPVADAFWVAFRFPNLFRRFFGEGAFNSAFVPLFAKTLESQGKGAALAFAEEVLAVLLTALLGFTLVCQLLMPWLMYALAYGFRDDPVRWPLSILFSQIAFPYLLFMSLVALYAGMLNSVKRFAAAAAVPTLLNLSLIGALFALKDVLPTAGHALAWGTAAAGVLQFLFIAFAAARSGLTLRLRRPRMTPAVRRILILGLPGVVAGGITQINLLVGTFIASLQDGAISLLGYADRLFELPLAIMGTAMGVVLLPELSRRLRAGDERGARTQMNRALEISALFTLPATAALLAVPHEIVQVVLERGAFTAAETAPTSAALAAFALGLPAFVLNKVFSPGYFAREDTATPMRYAGIGVAINIAASLGLFFTIGFVGIALGTSLGAWANALLLGRGLHKVGNFAPDARLRRRGSRIALAASLMGIGVYGIAQLLEPAFAAGGLNAALGLMAVVFAGAAIFFGLAHALGAARLGELRQALLSRAAAPAGEGAP
ncbi:MAG: murein biosynthesis integral membrane protein MurJ [Alphaproteobacteria bacterium]|nr:murein biosynthesis integral membrane protein MurJ [Alphaproteobacteria bacterium]